MLVNLNGNCTGVVSCGNIVSTVEILCRGRFVFWSCLIFAGDEGYVATTNGKQIQSDTIL